MESLYPEKPLAGFYVTSLRGYATPLPRETLSGFLRYFPVKCLGGSGNQGKEGMPPLYPGEVGENREGGVAPRGLSHACKRRSKTAVECKATEKL